jgi:DNA-binding beta-propeller fold protein YncE
VLVSSGGQFENPTGVAIGPGGELFVSDPDALGGQGAIFMIDPETGAQQVISGGGSFDEPIGIAVNPLDLAGSMRLLVADRDSDPPRPDVFGDGNVISIDPETGGQTSVLSPPQGFAQRPLLDPSGVWPSPRGRWFVADPNAGDGGSGAVFEQPPANRLFPFPPLAAISSGGELVDVAAGTIVSDPGLPEQRGTSARPVVFVS